MGWRDEWTTGKHNASSYSYCRWKGTKRSLKALKLSTLECVDLKAVKTKQEEEKIEEKKNELVQSCGRVRWMNLIWLEWSLVSVKTSETRSRLSLLGMFLLCLSKTGSIYCILLTITKQLVICANKLTWWPEPTLKSCMWGARKKVEPVPVPVHRQADTDTLLHEFTT